MPDEPVPLPEPRPPEQPTLLGNIPPDEMLARGMQSVKMTSGTAGTWQPPTAEELARLFPNCEILGLLGRGGMGAVYKARQTLLDRIVAIKLLPLEISVDKDFSDRFIREARAMAKLHHPNIITVHEFGNTSEGHLFFVMEYVEGANLADIIHQVGLDGGQALSLVEQVCTALAYAHNKGIVHRDIKPANVMIDMESQVKVADFGLARLTDPSAEQMGHTMTGTVMGTPDYMAPEQMKGMNVDHRADIYSLGVMVYEMLCREVPRGIFHPPSRRTGCDTRIDDIVIKAMQQAPDDRYQSTQEMKADVVAARAIVVSEARPAPGPPPPKPPARPAAPKPPKLGAGKPLSPPAPPKSPEAEVAANRSRETEVFTNPPAPAPPESAVMQAIPRPGPAKAKTSRYAGFAIGIIALAAGAFFIFKPKSEPIAGRAPSVTPRGTPVAAHNSTPPATSAPAATTAGWQPLFADTEWRASGDRHEFADGRVHITFSGVMHKSAPSPDGAIRTRIAWRDGSEGGGLTTRQGKGMGNYKFTAAPNGKSLLLTYYPPDVPENREVIGTYPLSAALRPGDTFTMELRLQGDKLTGLFNGAVVIEAHDDRIKGAGDWGIYARDGWFESVEVQSFGKPAAGAAAVQSFGGHRYQFVPGRVSWADARTKAEAMGGHLVTITSKEENSWIIRTFGDDIRAGTEKKSCMLGGYAETPTGGWKWVTGEPFQFQAWAAGKPDYQNSNGSSMPGPYGAMLWFVGSTSAPFVWTEIPQNWVGTAGFLVEWDTPSGAGAAAAPAGSKP